MASRSNFTSYYHLQREYFDPDVVSRLRQRESALFAAMVGGRHVDVGLPDAPLRFCDRPWSLEEYRRYRPSISAATSRLASPQEEHEWAQRVDWLFRNEPSDEIWVPLGGPHADHRLTVSHALSALVRDASLRESRAVRLYQEVPYAARFPNYTHTALTALREAGFELQSEDWPIDDVVEDKLRLISVYGSQFKIHVLREDILRSARGDGRGTSERTWKITGWPTPVAAERLNARSPIERASIQRLAMWASRARSSARLRVILQMPSGRWDRDAALLLHEFSAAEIEVLVTPGAQGGLIGAADQRLKVSPLRSGKAGWLSLATSFRMRRPMPTLWLVGSQHMRVAGALAQTWVGSHTATIASMDYLHEAIALVKGHAS